MSRQDLKLKTRDGEMRSFAFRPAHGAGPWPGVLMYLDGLAMRPTLFEIAQRVSDMGYVVLLPDMFWRVGDYPPLDIAEAMASRAFMQMMGSTDPERAMSDTRACLDWFEAQPDVKNGKIGVMGYCFGGGLTLRAAAAFPDRVGAAAAFHPGGLVTDQPNSVHLQAPKVKAKVLVAGGDNDNSFTAEQCATLAKAFDDAGVDAEVGIWPGALHGFVPPDLPAYNREASERHYREAGKLFAETL